MKIRCDQCEPMMIQGVFCHETGCPNMRKVWDGERWIDEEIEDEDEDV